MVRKRRIKAGNLDDLKRVLWATIIEVEALLDARPPSHDLVLRSANTLAQLAGAYTRLIDVSVVLPRLAALEAALAAQEKAREPWAH
jgi:hypothetical protein